MENISFKEIECLYLQDIMTIYNYYVLNTTATFHDHRITEDQMKEIVFFDNPRYKTFVIFEDGNICGYVLLTQHKKREAYDDTAEVTVYLRPDCTGRGIGSMAVQFIEAVAVEKRFHVLVATICGDNNSSIRLFEKNGYFKCAHYREVGKKFGKLLDIVAYQKIL